MPPLLKLGPYRFFCYAGDRDEPPHVHIERDQNEAKFWLEPVRSKVTEGLAARKLIEFRSLLRNTKSNC